MTSASFKTTPPRLWQMKQPRAASESSKTIQQRTGKLAYALDAFTGRNSTVVAYVRKRARWTSLGAKSRSQTDVPSSAWKDPRACPPRPVTATISTSASCASVNGVIPMNSLSTRQLRSGGLGRTKFVSVAHNVRSLSAAEWNASIAPKVQGTWNLHRVSVDAGVDLDFFLMFSSVSGIVGQAGQANYASGNCYEITKNTVNWSDTTCLIFYLLVRTV
jgi:hypothetical protein